MCDFVSGYTQTLIGILLLLDCVTTFPAVRNPPRAWRISADSASLSLKLGPEGGSWGHRGKKKRHQTRTSAYTCTYTDTEDSVNTRKFSAFAPQLSSSFSVHSIYLLGIYRCASPDKQNPLSLCAPSRNAAAGLTDEGCSASATQVARVGLRCQRPLRAACAR